MGDERPCAGNIGMLSIVGTPIGNLGDASPRSIETLRHADLILCEDTRVTARLLAHFDIHVPLRRADENALGERIAPTLERVARGGRVCFVSDAGMPGVSDPGQRLVDAALDAGLPVEVVPGPSAVTCALVASGLPMAHFFFEGFLPRRRAALEARLLELAMIPGAVVIYESPRRVSTTLASVSRAMPMRQVALARELTKVHEEVLRGRADELAARVAARGELRGECVIVLGPPSEEELAERARPAPEALDVAAHRGLAAGESKSALARRLSREYALPRSAVYDKLLELASDERCEHAQE